MCPIGPRRLRIPHYFSGPASQLRTGKNQDGPGEKRFVLILNSPGDMPGVNVVTPIVEKARGLHARGVGGINIYLSKGRPRNCELHLLNALGIDRTAEQG